MKSVMERFLGSSSDAKIDLMFGIIAETAVKCAVRLRESRCADVNEVMELERGADAVEDQIHEIMDSTTLLHLDKPDIEHLASRLDNILDGMRKVVLHVEAEASNLPEFGDDALHLLNIIELMVRDVQKLVRLLVDRTLTVEKVKLIKDRMEECETEADTIRRQAGIRLGKEYSDPARVYEKLALENLYGLLERVTDAANSCGNVILTLARKGV